MEIGQVVKAAAPDGRRYADAPAARSGARCFICDEPVMHDQVGMGSLSVWQ